MGEKRFLGDWTLSAPTGAAQGHSLSISMLILHFCQFLPEPAPSLYSHLVEEDVFDFKKKCFLLLLL